MNWLSVALISYFLSSLVIILDKFILGAKKVSSPPVYSFYIGLLGLGAFIFTPFGFSVPSSVQIVVSLISGALFTLGILSLYYAISKAEASRVAPLVGAVIPFITFIISVLFLGENLNYAQMAGAGALVFGGLLISFDLPLKIGGNKFFSGFWHTILAGMILAVSYSLLKFVYNGQEFLNGFIWTRIGSALVVFSFFAVPHWRRDIVRSLNGFVKPTHSHVHAGSLVVLNKILGGTASILFNYAISLGSVTLVNALVSVQYVFILALAAVFSLWHPKVFKEKLYFWDWAQKVAAIAVIAVGIWLISLYNAGIGAPF